MLDGLSLLFVLLITGTGAFILVYASAYLAGHRQLGRFYAFILLFMASMLGLVLADNVITLFVFWELTSVSSYFLIGFDHERQAARAAARQLLRVHPRTLITAGLLTGLGSGITGLFAGRPFMTGLWLDVKLPVFGKMGTPVLFDAGVYLVVVGVMTLIIFSLMEE